jgi:hypothetical protein
VDAQGVEKGRGTTLCLYISRAAVDEFMHPDIHGAGPRTVSPRIQLWCKNMDHEPCLTRSRSPCLITDVFLGKMFVRSAMCESQVPGCRIWVHWGGMGGNRHVLRLTPAASGPW